MTEPAGMQATMTREEFAVAFERMLANARAYADKACEELAARLSAQISAMVGIQVGTELAAQFAEQNAKLRADLRSALRATEVRLQDQMVGMETRLSRDFATHARAITEEVTTRVAVLDEKYNDLPARVTRVEGDRPHPPPARPRARGRKH